MDYINTNTYSGQAEVMHNYPKSLFKRYSYEVKNQLWKNKTKTETVYTTEWWICWGATWEPILNLLTTNLKAVTLSTSGLLPALQRERFSPINWLTDSD